MSPTSDPLDDSAPQTPVSAAPENATPATANQKVKAVIPELAAVVRRHFELPEDVVAAYTQSFVRVMGRLERLKATIESHSEMTGDTKHYFEVCVVNESQLTKARVTRLEALEQDFLAGNEALKKEHREFREAVTRARARALSCSFFSAEKREFMLAALERYASLPAHDLKVLASTESAAQELRKYRSNMSKMEKEVEALVEALRKFRTAARASIKEGLQAVTEEFLQQTVNSVVDQLKYKSVLDVVEEINKVATDIRDTVSDERKRRTDQRARLEGIMGPTGRRAATAGDLGLAELEFEECAESYAAIFGGPSSACTPRSRRSGFRNTCGPSELHAGRPSLRGRARQQQQQQQAQRPSPSSRSFLAASTSRAAKENDVRKANANAAALRPGFKGGKAPAAAQQGGPKRGRGPEAKGAATGKARPAGRPGSGAGGAAKGAAAAGGRAM